ncbi:hypothetical protein Gogos_001195 [Gossypium gossypioides]|uniref:Uncharacterized protein n=1 Tax=Gossypium gossypioides TaxID=34282 RepID=A0A7J9CV85_GOSGO|nr:hypothetical protein [Gossypium gossypioides]
MPRFKSRQLLWTSLAILMKA